MTAPPLLFGVAAFAYAWPPDLAAQLHRQPADTLPLLLKQVTPPLVALLGMGAIIGAVTSSFSSSILSAGSMFSWNTCKRLLWPSLSVTAMKRTIRLSIAVLGGAAAVMALNVQSVQALWFFTSDLVFVLLFPQLVYALFDRKVNLAGSVTAFAVSLVLRLGGGEPLFGLAPIIRYPETRGGGAADRPGALVRRGRGAAVSLQDARGARGPGAHACGVTATARWSAPRPLRNAAA